jgi:TolB protein
MSGILSTRNAVRNIVMSARGWGISAAACVFGLSSFLPAPATAQTDLRVSGPQAGIPIAIPVVCDAGQASIYARTVAETLRKDLEIAGIFTVLNPKSFVETPGKCDAPNGIAYSDWSVIGADALVKGSISATGSAIRAELYLHDVQRKLALRGKRYEADGQDAAKIAHRFANEIMMYFTNEPGIFGTQIAYVSRVGRFKELFVVDLDGSNQRQLTRDRGLAMSPDWSPQGDSIAYMSYRTRRPQIFQIAASGGAPRQLTEHPELIGAPEYSADGSTVFAGASFGGFSNIVNIDLRSRALRKITSGSFLDTSPTPSPDGSRLALTSNRGGGPQIYVMPASGGDPRRISFTQSSYCTNPAWSPKGDKIAFTCSAGGYQIFLSSPDGGKAEQLTFGGNNEDPSWSPDGRYIVYSTNAGREKKLAVVYLGTAQSKLIGNSSGDDNQPAWSPLPN